MPFTNINSISAGQVQTSGEPDDSAGKVLPKETRVAILFHRFGPYHHARLNAAGRLMSVWGVEACATEDTYAWSEVEGATDFKRVTLTDHDSGDRGWRDELNRKMWQALDSIKPQVVVVPGWSYADALSALLWCAKNNVPTVVMTESTDWDEQRVPFKEWVKSRLVRLNSAGLAGGTPHGEYLRQLGLPRERVFFGYDVVDNDHFARRAEEGRKWKMEDRMGGEGVWTANHRRRDADGGDRQVKPSDPEPQPKAANCEFRPSAFGHSPYFLASARFVKKKNLSRLIEAYARYRDLVRKTENGKKIAEIWDLVLLGDGPLQSSIFHLRSSLNLEDCLHLPGFKQYDELPVYFGLAGAFIHASTTEQWGLVVNEAMASGLPVLVSHRCGCAEDLVHPGVNGFQFDPHNVEEMAQLMFKVSQNDFPLSDFGAASSRIISQWGPERFASGVRDAVTMALKTQRPSASLVDRILLWLMLKK